MSNEYQNIHAFDFNLICEYFSLIERQGPGSKESTLKALGFIDNLSKNSVIADLGCGTGGQTMTLAQHTTGESDRAGFISGFHRPLQQKCCPPQFTGQGKRNCGIDGQTSV